MTDRTRPPQYKNCSHEYDLPRDEASISASAPQHCDILIMTSSIGAGHVSVARAIQDGVHRLACANGGPAAGFGARVEIIDLMTTLENLASTTTKKIYLTSLRLSPKVYELLFSEAAEKRWPLKLLNILSAPFMQRKLRKLMEEKKPKILISTHPIWDMLIKKLWRRYNEKYNEKNACHAPFVSVITDVGDKHHAWTLGDPDYFCVPNNDTKLSLESFGICPERIKVFGYPINHDFFTHHNDGAFLESWALSPQKKTLLLILSVGIQWRKIKKLVAEMQKSSSENLQLIIVASGDESWVKKLKEMTWPWPTRVTGWTNQMHQFIHSADIVMTKAGGATVMECIHSKKPMMIIETLPGQESGNADMVEQYGLGRVLEKTYGDFDAALNDILLRESEIKKNLTAEQKPNAAEDIGRFLLSLI